MQLAFRKEENQSLKVAGDQDIHSRAKSLLTAFFMRFRTVDFKTIPRLLSLNWLLFISTSLPKSIQDIIPQGVLVDFRVRRTKIPH